MDFDLNIPTAIELMLQVLFLETPENSLALKAITKEQKDEMISYCIPKLYKCNYMPEISMSHSQMSIAVGSLCFFIYLDQPMHETMVLNDLLKRIKGVYIPGSNQRDSDQLLHNSKYDLTVQDIDENTRKIHFKAKKVSDKEAKFN